MDISGFHEIILFSFIAVFSPQSMASWNLFAIWKAIVDEEKRKSRKRKMDSTLSSTWLWKLLQNKMLCGIHSSLCFLFVVLYITKLIMLKSFIFYFHTQQIGILPMATGERERMSPQESFWEFCWLLNGMNFRHGRCYFNTYKYFQSFVIFEKWDERFIRIHLHRLKHLCVWFTTGVWSTCWVSVRGDF